MSGPLTARASVAAKRGQRAKRSAGYGRWGGRPPHRRFRTGRESFPSSGSSARGTLSMVQPRMCPVVTVGVEQHQVGTPFITPVAVPMVYLQHVLRR